MYERISDIMGAGHGIAGDGPSIGRSREGRPVVALRFGTGPFRVSLVAGSHADEPVGPRLLRHLVRYLSSLDPADAMLMRYEWWIIPHLNPDGEERNRAWAAGMTEAFDLGQYLAGVVRELPGDDIEFGYPRGPDDGGARPENWAAWDWWRGAAGPFDLHASLHGMGFGAGPWHLLEGAWRDRCAALMRTCGAAVRALGYVLHDVERGGEKGFERIERGFCTRPDSRRMRAHFEALRDIETAGRFRPSSMETVRSLGGDPLTLVSEMPLFLTPGVGEELGPPDPAAEAWRSRIEGWRARLAAGDDPRRISEEAGESGITPMPIGDQMRLQWRLVTAGIEQVEHERACGSAPSSS
ncbi:MAG: peptidase [marine benthic group bacterium]|nr:peptidase [Candidatus Benthicola marisminoris]